MVKKERVKRIGKEEESGPSGRGDFGGEKGHQRGVCRRTLAVSGGDFELPPAHVSKRRFGETYPKT